MRPPHLTASLLVVLLGACGEVQEVRVSVERGECDPYDLTYIRSISVELRRSDSIGGATCVDIDAILTKLASVQDLLGRQVSFDDLPSGGLWTLWIVGYDTAGCGEVALMCGKSAKVPLPGADGKISVKVDCTSLVSGYKSELIKSCITKK